MGEINRIKAGARPGHGRDRRREHEAHARQSPGRLFGTLGRNGINVIACAQGASETNISFVVTRENLRKSLNVIHDSFFLSEYQVLNIFIAGVGLVGSNLLEQIRLQQEKLMQENALKIRIVGITNSRHFIASRDGIDLNSYKEQLAASDRVSTPEIFRDEILAMNIFNPVFVDCTASPSVASIYEELLSHNVSVVAANKIAASSSEYDHYAETQEYRPVARALNSCSRPTWEQACRLSIRSAT